LDYKSHFVKVLNALNMNSFECMSWRSSELLKSYDIKETPPFQLTKRQRNDLRKEGQNSRTAQMNRKLEALLCLSCCLINGSFVSKLPKSINSEKSRYLYIQIPIILDVIYIYIYIVADLAGILIGTSVKFLYND
jgi:hypothetical protein